MIAHITSLLDSYPFSKLALFFSMREFTAQNPASKSGVVINFVNPGLCDTKLDRNAPFMARVMIWTMKKVMARTAEVGSRTLLHGVAAGEESHGKYLSECRIRE